MSRPTVSVVVPVYNRSKLIGQTLRALQAQTRPPDEIIIVDDGSTDDTVAVARRYVGPGNVVEVPNGGPARARNRGLIEARGEFIQFMDSDDLPTPQFIAARLRAMKAARADIAYGPWMPAWINGDTVTGDGLVRQNAAVARPLDAFLQEWVLFIPNAMIRRSLLEDAGGYPEGMMTGEDMLLLFRMLRRTSRLAHTDRSLLLVRQHPEGQISASSTLAARRIIDELILTGTVSSELKDGAPYPVVPSQAAVRAWARRRTRAFASALRAKEIPPREAGAAPGAMALASVAAADVLTRLAARLQYQRFGHRLAHHFHPTAIRPDHVEEVRALGLNLLRPGQAVRGSYVAAATS